MGLARHEKDWASSSETLPKWGLVVATAFSIAGLLVYRDGGFREWPVVYSAGGVFGRAFAMLVIVGSVSFLFAKPRRFPARLIGLVVYAVIYLLVAPTRATSQRASFDEEAGVVAQIKRDALAQIEERGWAEPQIDRMSAVLADLRANADGSDEGRMAAALISVSEELLVLGAAKQDATAALAALGTVASASSLEDVAAFKEAVEATQRANEGLLAFLAEYLGRCEAALRDFDVSAAARRDALAGFIDGTKVDQLVAIADCDTAVLDALWHTFDLVEADWDDLSFQDGQIIFPNEASLDRFNELQEVIESNTQRQIELQKRLLGGADSVESGDADDREEEENEGR